MCVPHTGLEGFLRCGASGNFATVYTVSLDDGT